MKKEWTFFLAILLVMTVILCGCTDTQLSDSPGIINTMPPDPYMELLYEYNYHEDENNNGNFEKSVSINDETYQINSKEISGKSIYDYGKEYEITINDAKVIYTTERYYMSDAYVTDLNLSDNSIEIFITSVYDNDYTDITAYRYSNGEIRKLKFYSDEWEYPVQVVDIGMRYNGLSLKGSDIELTQSTSSYGCWGVKRYIYDAGEDTLVFRLQDKYEVLSYVDEKYGIKTYDYDSKQWVPYSYDDVVNNPAMNVTSEYDYKMLLNGYVKCGMSYGGINEGEYFKLIYDDRKGTVTYRTSDGKEGEMDVNSLRDQETRIKIGGIILMMVA